MNIKDHIRRRRQDRIYAILREQTAYRQLNRMTDRHLQADDRQSFPMDAHMQEAMADPEYVWKQKQRQWEKEQHLHGDHRHSGPRFLKTLQYQVVGGILAFCLIWGLFQLDDDWARQGQTFIERHLNEDFAFDAVAKWYDQFFRGTPSFLPTYQIESPTEKVNVLK